MSEVLTIETFKEKVFDFENEKDWNYKGDKPAILDFYADWCGPCKMTGPILEEIDTEHEDIDVFKIDVDATPELAGMFGVTGIPMFLFVPVDGTPSGVNGAIPKEKFEEAINDIFYGIKPEEAQADSAEEAPEEPKKKSGLVDIDGNPF